jgi:uncharacterized Zn-finger protein
VERDHGSCASGRAGIIGTLICRSEEISPRVAAAKPLIEANAQNQYQVSSEDLPLCCPMPQMYLWNSHPRVYLAVEATGWAKCPYCGAEYTLRR